MFVNAQLLLLSVKLITHSILSIYDPCEIDSRCEEKV